jgi:tetratricopeptide (TPR) repeat protein
MRQRLESSRFTKDLPGSNPRQFNGGALRGAPEFSVAAAVATGAVSLGHQRLTELVAEGEKAQSLRNSEGLARTSRHILALPLGDGAFWIGKYFEALAVNRRGRHASSEANRVLTGVADHGPEPFRAKACVVIGSNLYDSGDNKAALELYGDALRIAQGSERGDIQLFLIIRSQIAVIDYAEGNHSNALARLQELWPTAMQVGGECAPLLHQYYNNLAVALATTDRVNEALPLCKILEGSPFSAAFPEFGETCSDLRLKTRSRSSSVVAISAPPVTKEHGPNLPAPELSLNTAANLPAMVPVETRRQVPSPAALKWARIATGRLRASLPLHRTLFAHHLSFSPTPNTEARPLSPVRLDPEPVRERRRVRRPSARAPPPASTC